MDVLAQIGADGLLEPGHGGRHRIDPLDHERQRLPHVSNDDLQFGMRVEHAAERHAQHVQRRLDVPAPAAVRHHFGDRRLEAAVPSLDNRFRRLRRMKIDRQLERLGALKDGPEEPVVEIAPLDVPVDHHALAAVRGDRPLEFADRRRRVDQRQRGQPEKPVRMTPDRFADRGVGLARDALGFLARAAARRRARSATAPAS